MLHDRQKKVIQQLCSFGWVPDVRNYYRNDSIEGVMVIARARENVIMIYPDGTFDRAGDQAHSKHYVKPRAGWYSPVKSCRPNARRTMTLRSDVHDVLSQLLIRGIVI